MNIQIFAFTELPDFQGLLEVECKEITGHRPVIHHSLDELKGIIEIFQTIDVLIIDEPESPKDCHDLLDFLTAQESRFVKILILGEKISSKGKIKCYRRIEIGELFDDLKNFARPATEDMNGWTAVPLSTLVHFQSLPFDLFVRISSERFVKRIPAFESVDDELIQSYKSKGVHDLYCEKKYNRDFSMMLINNMINRVEQQYGSHEEKLQANNEVFLTVREIVQTLGLSSRVVEVCESTIERITTDVLMKKDQFSGYLRALKDDPKLAFHFKLIELTSFICAQLVHGMHLPNQTEQVKKLVFASFFCDITLSNPNFIHFRRADQVEHMTLEDYNEINFHALRASELVSTYRHTPKEVSLIIRQHHGSFGGIGFPKQRSPDLLPLAKILLIAQDLAYDILVDRDGSVLDVLKSFVRKHQHSGFHDLLQVLEGKVGKDLRELA